MAPPGSPHPPPAPARLDHYALEVTDLDRALRFYVDLLGMSLTRREADPAHGEAFACLELEGGRIELRQLLDPPPRADALVVPPPRSYAPHVALRVDDLDAELARLQSSGVGIARGPLSVPGRVRWAWFTDPDGNLIEYVQWL
jgi:catechol 2,3-dioxygenase-like lactoylglutathione lyase family enzyme